MAKLLVVKSASDSGFPYDTIYIGNDLSRDPADIILLVKQQFRTYDWGDGELHLCTEMYSTKEREDLIAFLTKNGYTEINPEFIFV